MFLLPPRIPLLFGETFTGRLAVSLCSRPQACTPLIILGWLLIFLFGAGGLGWGGGVASFLSPFFSSAQQPFPIHNSWHSFLALAARDHTPNHFHFFFNVPFVSFMLYIWQRRFPDGYQPPLSSPYPVCKSEPKLLGGSVMSVAAEAKKKK